MSKTIRRMIVLLGMFPLLLAFMGCESVSKVTDLKMPSLSGMLKGKDPVTTSLKDAVNEIGTLDSMTPVRPTPMGGLSRDANGGFIINRPGFYTFEAQSYCLHAGTYAPGKGDGYLYAPLLGSKEVLVGNILKRSVAHPEIPQHDIQVLLWAIVSRTKIKDMPPEMIGTAVKLLDAKELYDLNGGALGLVPESLKSQAMGGLPSEVRMVLEAEAKLRGMLTSAQSTYKDLERVAVLVGAAPLGAGSRMTPDGRWSYHPDGYFVQYHPSGYSHTTVNIYVPECMTIERDGQGRITRIVDASGKKMDISYSGEGTVVTDDGSVKAHGFATVRCPSGSGRGYTLTGIPRGTGAPTGGGSFPDLAQRLQWAVKATRSEDRGGVFFRGQTVEEEDMNLAHLEYGLTKGGAGAACLELVRKARMYEICRRQGKCSSCGQVVYEPSMSVAQPGNTAKQRLAQSARPYSGH